MSWSPGQALDRLRARLNETSLEPVESIRVGGSVGRGSGDKFSDIDLFLVARTGWTPEQCLGAIVQELGAYHVLDIPRTDSTWGMWVTGVFVEFGYVDVCAFPDVHPGTTYMTDRKSLIFLDRSGGLSSRLSRGRPTQSPESWAPGHAAQAWLKLYKAGREILRGGKLQFSKYLFESVEGSAGLFRAALRCPPPGNYWDQPTRRLERDLPSIARRAWSALRPQQAGAEDQRRRVALALDLLRAGVNKGISRGLDLGAAIPNPTLTDLSEALASMKALPRYYDTPRPPAQPGRTKTRTHCAPHG